VTGPSPGPAAGSLVVRAPVPGRVLTLADVPDPVFAEGMVGPGAALDPPRGPVTAVSPVAGRLLKVHPHACVVVGPEGRGVLVHLGIDTVALGGEGFTLHAAEGDDVDALAPVVSWDAAAVEDGGRSPVCPVVALDAAPGDLAPAVAPGDPAASEVAVGATLFTWG
jgi:sugar PTS system EIIA component